MPTMQPPPGVTRFYDRPNVVMDRAGGRPVRPCIDLTGRAPISDHDIEPLLQGVGAKDRPLTCVWEWIMDLALRSPILMDLITHAARENWVLVYAQRAGDDPFVVDPHDRRVHVGGQGLPPHMLIRHSFYRWDYLDRVIDGLRSALHTRLACTQDDYPRDLLRTRHERADHAVLRALVYAQLREGGEPTAWRYRLGTQDSDLALALMHSRLDHCASEQAEFLYPLWYCQRERLTRADRIHCKMHLMRLDNDSNAPVIGHACPDLRAWLLTHSVLPGEQHSYLGAVLDDVLGNPYYASFADEGCREIMGSIAPDLTHRPAGVPGGVPHPLRCRDAGLQRRLFGGE